MIITYLGPKGTQTEEATMKLLKRLNIPHQIKDLPSFEAVAKSLLPDSKIVADLSVLPYYNDLEGLVPETVDLIYKNNLKIIGLETMVIEWAAARYPGTTNPGKVYSKDTALRQCGSWLWNNYPEIERIPALSSTAGIKPVLEEKNGIVIAKYESLVGALEVFATDIGDRREGRQNYTKFFLLANNENKIEHECDANKEYNTFVVINPHIDEHGVLYRILGEFDKYEINIADLHSRPPPIKPYSERAVVSTKREPSLFYVELEMHKEDEKLKDCVSSISELIDRKNEGLDIIRVLGSYERPKI